MQGIPDFYKWKHICKFKHLLCNNYPEPGVTYSLLGLAYDVFKDTFKIYADGVKVESGSWSENPNVWF